MLLDNMDVWVEVLNVDFGNCFVDEIKLVEMFISVEGIKYYVKYLCKWMKFFKCKVGVV